MSEYGQQNDKPKFIKTAFDEAKARLTADVPKGGNPQRKPTLSISYGSNSPAFLVRTNVEADDKNGFARAGMDHFAFVTAMQLVQDVIDGKIEKGSVECDTGAPNDRRLDAKFAVGRETDEGTGRIGTVFVAVLKKGITPVKFYLEPSIYHRIFINGEEIDSKKRSEVAGRAWVKSVLDLLGPVANSHFVERVYVPQDGKQGWQNNGGNYGGGQKKSYNNNSGPDSSPVASASYEDDLPM